jgi:uncharacterized protein with GYD domain
LGEWDIIGIGSTDFVLVHVLMTRGYPGLVEMGTLQAFAAPANAKKLVKCWRDRPRVPDVREAANA